MVWGSSTYTLALVVSGLLGAGSVRDAVKTCQSALSKAFLTCLANSSATAALQVADRLQSESPWAHPWQQKVLGEQMVGEGTFGQVWLSHFNCDSSGDWYAAIKIPKGATVDKQALRNEFAIQDKLSKHTGLSTAVLDTVEKDGRVYALTEAARGGNVYQFVNRFPNGLANVDGGKLLHVMFAQILLATMRMHRAGIVHLDMKPENMLINKKECRSVETQHAWIQNGCAIKLTDFGLSCVVQTCGRGTAGTPTFMSPQQFNGEDYKQSMDVFAVGLILKYMMFKRFVYPEETIKLAIASKVNAFGILKDALAELKDRDLADVGGFFGWLWYWKQKVVLEHCLRKDDNKRSSMEQVYNLPWLLPMHSYAEQSDQVELASSARRMPKCVRSWTTYLRSKFPSWSNFFSSSTAPTPQDRHAGQPVQNPVVHQPIMNDHLAPPHRGAVPPIPNMQPQIVPGQPMRIPNHQPIMNDRFTPPHRGGPPIAFPHGGAGPPIPNMPPRIVPGQLMRNPNVAFNNGPIPQPGVAGQPIPPQILAGRPIPHAPMPRQTFAQLIG